MNQYNYKHEGKKNSPHQFPRTMIRLPDKVCRSGARGILYIAGPSRGVRIIRNGVRHQC